VSDLAFASISELGRRYRSGALTPLEVTEASLARIARLDRRLSAFVTVTGDLARQQARLAGEELRAGKDRGPMHGIPYALKDVIDTAGIRTTYGARVFADRVPAADAAVVTRMRGAGAVLVGKLACIELAGALGCSAPWASLTGVTRNPWDPSRWAGGSSSGAGAAVAAGLVPLAVGTETLGSILCPAAFCGVTGLRPTYGVVSRRGVMPLSYTMDKVGVIARSAAGAAAALLVLAGRDPQDPASHAPPRRLATIDPAAVRGVRIGLVEQDLGYHLHPSIPIFLEGAVRTLERLGARVETVRLPALPYRDVAEVISNAEAVDAFEDLVRSGRVRDLDDPRHRTGDDYFGPARAVDYVRAMRVRTVIEEALGAIFDRSDLLLALNSPIPAPAAGEPLPAGGGELMQLVGNIAGLPALALPMGLLAPGRLPVSLQLVGRPFDESRLLSVADAYQGATDWHEQRPPLA
jgi:aspartyl-tRNA(Asn)/glutamyl-tRNA(Gln) amidotransferase subunit A